MAKRKNKLLSRVANKYSFGTALGLLNKDEKTGKNSVSAGAGGIANAFAGVANTLMNPNGNTTGIGNTMSAIGSAASNIPGIGGLIGAGVNLAGGLVNAAFGSNINDAAVANIESNIANQKAINFDYSSSDNLLGDWSNYKDLGKVKTSDVGSDGWFSDKAKDKAEDLNRQAQEANLIALANFANAANNLDAMNTKAALVNYGANGGPLTMRYTGLMSPFGSRFSDGGKIYIKPSKRGTFTAAAKKRGMGVLEFASKVLANKEDYSTAMVKKANFARNANKWHGNGGPMEDLVSLVNSKDVNFVRRLKDKNRKSIPDWEFPNNIATHKLGVATDEKGNNYIYPEVQEINGELVDFTRPPYHPSAGMVSAEERGDTVRVNSIEDGLMFTENYKKYYPKGNTFALGGDFTNGITMINNGSTHEQNPMEGVLMGVDNQGIPNLVEEGELIWNDYVFSNRLKVPKAIRQKYKLREDITFAEAIKKLQKESEERPNDPISLNGLNAIMSEMAMSLEEIRMKKEKNKYAKGGKLGKLYKGTGDSPNFLNYDFIDTFPEVPTPTYNDIFGNSSRFTSRFTPIELPTGEIIQPEVGSIGGNPIIVPENKDNNNKAAYLRYAPVLNTGLNMLTDAIGLTNRPDYTPVENIMDAADRASRVNKVIAPRIGNYMTYNPVDINYLTNKQAAEAAANRRAIANLSGGNRANYMANLLASDYANQSVLGDTFLKTMEANRAQRQAVEEFNRGTNTTNAEAAMGAALINQAAEQLTLATRLAAIERAEQMRNQIDAASSTAISANKNAFFKDLGNIGRDEWAFNASKNSPFTMYYQDRLGNWHYKGEEEKKNGGYLTIKNKKRRK